MRKPRRGIHRPTSYVTIGTPDNVVDFPGLQNLEQDAGPHRDVIATVTHIIRQMSGLVNAINEGPATDAEKAKYAIWLYSASALCLRVQLEYFDHFIDGSARTSDGPSFQAPLSPGPPA